MDSIKVEILPDGTIKIETDKVSMPNHCNAEMFIREVAKLAGGQHTHTHKHGHQAHAHGTQVHQH